MIVEATLKHPERTNDVQQQLTKLRAQQDRLLNMRLLEEIDALTFSKKNIELRDRIAERTLRLEASQRTRDEHADLALKVFELSQSVCERLVSSDYAEKRRFLEILCLNFRLDGATLVMTMRKPFDMLVKGLPVESDRRDGI